MFDITNVSVSASQMLSYLEAKLKKFEYYNERYGMDDRRTSFVFDEMIACKEMVEALICAPVNLQKDGKVTVGF